MPTPKTTARTVAQFCGRHGLDLHGLLVLAYSHRPLLPKVIDNGHQLVVLDFVQPDGGLKELPPLADPMPDDTPASAVLSVEDFCEQHLIDTEALLRLALQDDLPRPARHGERLVFPKARVSAWRLGRSVAAWARPAVRRGQFAAGVAA